uniref:Carboxylic ester hydrolase n=1 Tax=Ectropis obliqua TaxID=248899 RepID=A0A2S0D870_ECTOB|nr:putative antennal esterase CXE10 [Ectropis obliqua]
MVQVRVAEGLLEGEVVENEFGGKFCSFKGIPYAEPPERFKAPQPKKPWDGVRSAKEFGSVCIQVEMLSGQVMGSEDCLFLNVYTPDVNPGKPWPVMVFIHGGGFISGSSNDDLYGPEFLVRHGIILVTLNYRLEALGFLSLDTEDIPGNAGMKDQVAALRWVKANIKHFGGDSENITIFGESAGGASSSYHLVSPMSKGLFNKAIVQSGALTCNWAQCVEPRERALKLARQLGCHSEDDKVLAEFFRNVDAMKLIGLKLPLTQSDKLYELSFAVTDEKQFGENERFFYGDHVEVLKRGIHDNVKVMTGYTQDEGIIAFGLKAPLEQFIAKANEFKEFFVPKPIQFNCSIKDQIEVGRKIKEFYFNKDVVSKENFDQLLKFLSWDMFLHGCLLLAKLISNKNKVYLYKLTCKSERNIFAHLAGLSDVVGDRQLVSHADDLFYLFPGKITQKVVKENSPTFTLIDRMTTLWTNFAKYSDPTPDSSLGVKWLPYTLKDKHYLDIGNQLAAGVNPDGEDDAFWDSIFKKYLPSYAV